MKEWISEYAGAKLLLLLRLAACEGTQAGWTQTLTLTVERTAIVPTRTRASKERIQTANLEGVEEAIAGVREGGQGGEDGKEGGRVVPVGVDHRAGLSSG